MIERKKILFVDDEPDIRELLKLDLCDEGYQVILAADGREGLKQAQLERPDLIILDILMPGMDGTEMGSLLKESELTKNIPVIFLTGLKSKEEELHEAHDHPNLIFTKPYDAPALIGKIEEVLGTKEIHSSQ